MQEKNAYAASFLCVEYAYFERSSRIISKRHYYALVYSSSRVNSCVHTRINKRTVMKNVILFSRTVIKDSAVREAWKCVSDGVHNATATVSYCVGRNSPVSYILGILQG